MASVSTLRRPTILLASDAMAEGAGKNTLERGAVDIHERRSRSANISLVSLCCVAGRYSHVFRLFAKAQDFEHGWKARYVLCSLFSEFNILPSVTKLLFEKRSSEKAPCECRSSCKPQSCSRPKRYSTVNHVSSRYRSLLYLCQRSLAQRTQQN